MGAVPAVAASTLLTPGPARVTAATFAGNERWPDIPFRPDFRGLVQQGLDDYRPGDHTRNLVDYSSTGTYFKYGDVVWDDTRNSAYRFDSDGVPQSLYRGEYWDHPVTLCRYSLHLHDRITRYGESENADLFFRVVGRLIGTQDATGAYRYPFPYRVYGHDFAAGWA